MIPFQGHQLRIINVYGLLATAHYENYNLTREVYPAKKFLIQLHLHFIWRIEKSQIIGIGKPDTDPNNLPNSASGASFYVIES